MNYSSQVSPKESSWYRFLSTRWFLSLVAILLLFSACGESGEKETDYPLPGHMQVLSVEPAAPMYSTANLIFNGDFSIWHAGAPAPEGFYPPSDSGVSRLIKREPRGGPGRNSVDQLWFESDSEEVYTRLFHTIVKGIEPGKNYELFVSSLTYDETTVDISVYGLDPSGNRVVTWPSIITITAGHQKGGKYTGTFLAENITSVAIASHTNPATPYRGRTVWREWRLTEIPNG